MMGQPFALRPGSCLLPAIPVKKPSLQGFLELMERDACAIWWYNRSRRAAVDLDRFEDSYVRDLKAQLEDRPQL